MGLNWQRRGSSTSLKVDRQKKIPSSKFDGSEIYGYQAILLAVFIVHFFIFNVRNV
jgi:hypothetical protein